MPYRLSVVRLLLAKYWLKFSSPCSVVPQGVVPPEQLLRVPRTLVPVGSTEVLSRSERAGGPRQPELGGGGDAAVELVPGDGGELAGAPVLLDHDGGQPVRGPGDLDLVAGRVGGVVAAEHQNLVGVLVVRDEERMAALTGEREQRKEVVVVAELVGLGLRRLVLRVEGGGAAQDRLAPADDDVLLVPVGDGHGVGGVGLDGGEPQTAGGPALALPRARARGGFGRGRGGGRGGAERGGRTGRGGHGDDGGGSHHRAAAQRARDDVAHVGVGAGVGHLVEAGVTTAEPTGQGGTAAGMRADHGQQLAHSALLDALMCLLGVSVTLGGRVFENGDAR